MDLTYFGHATFLASAADGTTILIDPFNPEVGYPMPEVRPTAVTLSHEHSDHNYVKMAQGSPKVIRGLQQGGSDWNKVDERVGQVHVRTVPTFHDKSRGGERGRNAVFIFETEGLRVVHLGDLGHTLDPGQVESIGQPDVLMIPVGGHFTIGPSEADEVVRSLNARLVLPMHYKTAVNQGWPIATVDEFVGGKEGVRRQGNTVNLSAAALPREVAIWVLSPGAK